MAASSPSPLKSLLDVNGEAHWSLVTLMKLGTCTPEMLNEWLAQRKNQHASTPDSVWSIAHEIREHMIRDNNSYMIGIPLVTSKCVNHAEHNDLFPLALASIGVVHPDFKFNTTNEITTDAWHLLTWWLDQSTADDILENLPWMMRDTKTIYDDPAYLPPPSSKMSLLLGILAPTMTPFEVLNLAQILWQPETVLTHADTRLNTNALFEMT